MHVSLRIAATFFRSLTASLIRQRFDVLAAVQNLCAKTFAKRDLFVVQLRANAARQSTRKRPTYVIVITTEDCALTPPPTADILSVRASSSECLRERCLDRKCRLRAEPIAEEEDDVDAELNRDDRAVEGEDDEVDVEEMAEDDEAVEAYQAAGPPAGSDRGGPKRNLHVFAKPCRYYSRILLEVADAARANHFLYLSRTSHPGALVGARDVGMEVHALIEGPKEHSINHGFELLERMLIISKWKPASAACGLVRKRVRTNGLPYIVVEAPPEQAVRLKDVAPKDSSCWRAGLNRAPSDVSGKIASLLAWELTQTSMYLEMQGNGQMSLCSTKSFREGEVSTNVCQLSSSNNFALMNSVTQI